MESHLIQFNPCIIRAPVKGRPRGFFARVRAERSAGVSCNEKVLHWRHDAFAEQDGAAEQRAVSLFFRGNKNVRTRLDIAVLRGYSPTIGAFAGMVIFFSPPL